ncbi:MAG TPA: hypothetical protein VE782_15635 [Myxococcaceae bacterium]|jgi:hypothetical protein|nr:hypothetical protein [Myxococcaceae bacterium]
MQRANLIFLAAITAAVLSACGGSSIGRTCTQNGDCDNGQTCFLDMPGGYCSKECTIEGQSDECPGGSLCATTGTRRLCSDVCTVQSDCRAEYECNGVTGSSAKVCRPKTTP